MGFVTAFVRLGILECSFVPETVPAIAYKSYLPVCYQFVDWEYIKVGKRASAESHILSQSLSASYARMDRYSGLHTLEVPCSQQWT